MEQSRLQTEQRRALPVAAYIDIGLERILDRAIPEPPNDLTFSQEAIARFPEMAGGLTLAVGRAFQIIDPNSKHPASEEWERAFQIFNLLL